MPNLRFSAVRFKADAGSYLCALLGARLMGLRNAGGGVAWPCTKPSGMDVSRQCRLDSQIEDAGEDTSDEVLFG
jgi:hypothetical protein